ncbi:MAG TPA: DUF2993 domain-containing protein [bacterium]|nr:DUF2993 domain-containing protein [bacterium]
MNASTGVGRSAPESRRAAKAARRRPGALWLTLVAVLALALAASVATPFIAGAAIRAALVRSFGTGDIAVTARAWPAPALWWGNIGTLSVAARALRIGRLDVAAFDAVLARVDVDPGPLYGRRELVVRSVGSGFARVMVTAENLARLVAAQPSVKQVAVHLRPGTMVLDGTVSVLGADFPASVAGHLAVRDAAHLDLVVDRVTVLNGLPVPPDVASRLAASINPILDLGSMPFGLRLTKVTIGQGIVMLQAAAGAPPLAGTTP